MSASLNRFLSSRLCGLKEKWNLHFGLLRQFNSISNWHPHLPTALAPWSFCRLASIVSWVVLPCCQNGGARLSVMGLTDFWGHISLMHQFILSQVSRNRQMVKFPGEGRHIQKIVFHHLCQQIRTGRAQKPFNSSLLFSKVCMSSDVVL